MSGIFPSMIDQADPVHGLPSTGSFAADTKYPLRAGGTAAARSGKTRFLPYYICIIIYMSAAAKGSAAFRPCPRPAGDGTDAAREAAETVPPGDWPVQRRPGDGSGENAGQGRAGFV